MYKMFKIRWICNNCSLLAMLISIESTGTAPIPYLADSSGTSLKEPSLQRIQFSKERYSSRGVRRDVVASCPENAFYDAVVNLCTLCSEVCSPSMNNPNYCIHNCPQYYRENILHIETTNSTSMDDDTSDKAYIDVDNVLDLELRLVHQLQVLPMPHHQQQQQPPQGLERLIDKPLFWTSVASLFVAVCASIFMVVLCLYRRRQQGHHHGCRRSGPRIIAALCSSSSDVSVSDDSQKDSETEDSTLSAEENYEPVHMPSTFSLLLSQYKSAGGFTSTPSGGTNVDGNINNINVDTYDVDIHMPSTTNVQPHVMVGPQFERNDHSVNIGPVHNITVNGIHYLQSDQLTMTSSLQEWTMFTLTDYEVELLPTITSNECISISLETFNESTQFIPLHEHRMCDDNEIVLFNSTKLDEDEENCLPLEELLLTSTNLTEDLKNSRAPGKLLLSSTKLEEDLRNALRTEKLLLTSTKLKVDQRNSRPPEQLLFINTKLKEVDYPAEVHQTVPRNPQRCRTTYEHCLLNYELRMVS